ncbi:MAG: hypothetical protein K2J79_09250 [Ruminiclostridium sp.]|nr:hypothetical protein [Ruminiclostridium sp.]
MARLREKWIMDHNSAMRNAEKKGIEETIAAMCKAGVSESMIQSALEIVQRKQ